MIPTRLHAVLDYVLPLGIAVMAASGRFSRSVTALMTAGPVWHLGYTLFTRYEGGAVPLMGMRRHLACDAAGALSFLAAGVLMREEPRAHRLLLAGIGLSELAVITLSSDRPRRRSLLPN